MKAVAALISAVALGGSVAFAQQPAPAPSAMPGQITITVNPAEVSMIGQALGARPYQDVAPLLAKLQKQLEEQMKPHAAEGSGLPPPPSLPLK